MKSDPQVPAAVDAAPPAALNKAVEVTLAKVHWHQARRRRPATRSTSALTRLNSCAAKA